MEPNDPSGRLTVEELSDCRSESSHSESQLRAFQDYDRIKELNLSVEKTKEDGPTEPKDFHMAGLESRPIRFDEFSCENSTRSLPLSLNKNKDFGYVNNSLNDMNYPLERSNENDESIDASLCRKSSSTKDLLFNLRENRQKGAHSALSLDRYGKELNFAVEKDIKDFGLLKNYSLDRMKEFNLSLDRMRDGHIGNFALERLRGGVGVLENPSILEHGEFKNIQVQPRGQDLEAIALERMRRSHLLGTDLSAQNLSTQLPHSHSITQMQHSQQQQQQQAKSFTIDAILGLRNNQREKRGQQQQYRKHQGQEGSAKNSSGGSCSGGGGKLKRVRTIFTAEQLERLEGEFARQQYMVGPERLYLAHALRLTEAQVKVWFQNRRIKWRKHHHEQQSQRVHEFQRTLNTSLEQEDSNEADKWNPSVEPVASCYSSTNSYKLHRHNHPASAPVYSRYNYEQRNPSQNAFRQCKEKVYPPYIARKSHFEDEDDIEKYINEELENMTVDNVDDDGEGEVEDREETEFLDKEYEEQEADDEIDEESDVPVQSHRVQRGVRKESVNRGQRWRNPEVRQEPRRLRCDRRTQIEQGHSLSGRYYQNLLEHENPEIFSEEEVIPGPPASKEPSRRSPGDRHWIQSRGLDRYGCTIQLGNRRARTKPEMDSTMDPDLGKIRTCSCCGSSSSKPIPPARTCRFDDRLCFPTKGPIGDEAEGREEVSYGRCNLRRNPEDPSHPCDIPKSAFYPSKLRRPRDVKSPIFEAPEKIEKTSENYSRSSTRHSRDRSTSYPEKTKRSVHTTHGPSRVPSRYVD